MNKTTITSGQMEWLLKVYREKGGTPERFQELQAKGFLTDLFDPAAVLDDRHTFRIALKLPSLKKLGSPTAFTYPAIDEPVDPNEFYQTRDGLWVDPDFVRWVLPAAKKLENLPELASRHYPLVSEADDGEIRGELPPDYVLEADEFCARVAEAIKRQWGNKTPGNFLSNGHTNIFYVRGVGGGVFAVGVGWYSGVRKWRVYASRSGDSRWGAGHRAFPRN